MKLKRVNRIVIAGAGTGKTARLAEEAIRFLLERKIEPSKLLALTFTEKAANQMSTRIMDYLTQLSRAQELTFSIKIPMQQLAKRAKYALAEIHKSEIKTIHSFATHILRLYPVEARVDPNFLIDPGENFHGEFKKAWERWLAGELGDFSPRKMLWKEVFEYCDLKELEELAVKLLKRDLSLLVLKEKISSYGSEGKVLELLLPFIEHFKELFLLQGFLGYDALLANAVRLLKENAWVRRELKNRYDVILVDEFQDTDPLQYEIILYLAEEDEDFSRDLKGLRLKSGKLFIVGDPKQSIYNFRGADIEAFELVRGIVKRSGKEETLFTNYRSHPEIIDFVNALFGRVIRKDPPYQPEYIPIKACEDLRSLAHKGVQIVLFDGVSKDQARELEAEFIARWIRELLYASKGSVSFRDIAILARRLTEIETYLEALGRESIPYIVEGEKYFYNTQEVIDFVNLISFVANPYDEISGLGFLRSPYGGLDDRQIYELRRRFGTFNYCRINPTGEGIFEKLRRLHEKSRSTTLSEIIKLILEEFSLLEITALFYPTQQPLANIQKLIQLAEKFSQEGASLKYFAEELRERILLEREEEEYSLFDQTMDVVQVMSIHRSKGLEFPFVIIPNIEGSPGERRERTFIYDWVRNQIGMSFRRSKSMEYLSLREKEKRKLRAEYRRLFYVAITRAKQGVLLCGIKRQKVDKDSFYAMLKEAIPNLEEKPSRIDGARFNVRITSSRDALPVSQEIRSQEKAFPKIDPERLHRIWKGRQERYEKFLAEEVLTSPSRLDKLEEGRVIEKVEFFPEEVLFFEDQKQAGLLCHEILARVDLGKVNPQELDGILRRLRGKVSSTILQEVGKLLTGFLASKIFSEIKSSEILGREVPFVLEESTRTIYGVIDIIYKVDGRIVVADYKTTPFEHDKLEFWKQRYFNQQKFYSQAVARFFGQEVVFKLIFLRENIVLTF